MNNEQVGEESRLRDLFAEAPVGIFRSRIDGRSLMANSRLCEIFGFDSPEQFVAAATDIANQFYFNPAERTRFIHEVLDQPEGGFLEREFKMRHGDGSVMFLIIRMRAVRDPQAQVLYVEGFIEDVTRRRRMEAALLASEQKYREIFNATNEAIFLHDAVTGRVLDVNGPMLKMYGFASITDFLAYGLDALSANQPPFTAVEVLARLRQAVHQGPQVFEWLARKKHGELFWVQVSLRGTEIGGQGRVLAVVQDITERKRAEAALQESEALFRAMIDSSPLAIYLSVGLEQKSEYINPTFVKLFGYTMADVPTLAHWLPLAYPDETYRRQLATEWQFRVKQAIANQSAIEPMESVVTCKDGSRKEMLWGSICIGKKNFTYGLDLTERKRAETALRESEEMHRIFFEMGAVGMACVKFDGYFLRVNRKYCAITGYARAELMRMSIFDLVPPEDRIRERERFAAYIGGQIQTFATQKRYLRKGGRVRWVAVTARLVQSSDGRSPYSIGIIEDITKRKQAEAALFHAKKELQMANGQLRQTNRALDQRHRQLAALTRQLRDSNQQLESRVAERTAQLRKLALDLTHAEERERRRIARILHDELQQILVGAKLHLASIYNRQECQPIRRRLEGVEKIIGQASATARGLSHELDLAILREANLLAGLKWLAGWMRENHGLNVQVRDDAGVEPAEESVKILIFQSVRELLFNVVKHAGVKQARVRISLLPDAQLAIRVSDQGKGFDIKKAKTSDRTRFGLGLFSIHDRLAVAGRKDGGQERARPRQSMPSLCAAAHPIPANDDGRRQGPPPDQAGGQNGSRQNGCKQSESRPHLKPFRAFAGEASSGRGKLILVARPRQTQSGSFLQLHPLHRAANQRDRACQSELSLDVLAMGLDGFGAEMQ